jgi:hypothetical protein
MWPFVMCVVCLCHLARVFEKRIFFHRSSTGGMNVGFKLHDPYFGIISPQFCLVELIFRPPGIGQWMKPYVLHTQACLSDSAAISGLKVSRDRWYLLVVCFYCWSRAQDIWLAADVHRSDRRRVLYRNRRQSGPRITWYECDLQSELINNEWNKPHNGVPVRVASCRALRLAGTRESLPWKRSRDFPSLRLRINERRQRKQLLDRDAVHFTLRRDTQEIKGDRQAIGGQILKKNCRSRVNLDGGDLLTRSVECVTYLHPIFSKPAWRRGKMVLNT